MIGLHVRQGVLYFNEQIISSSTGGSGLHAKPNRDLYFNDEKISAGDTANPIGLVYQNSKLYFDGIEVGGGDGGTPSDGEFSPEGYWIPPTQPANPDGKLWSYATILAKYDQLAAIEPRLTKHRYNDGSGNAILATAGGYEQFHYLYEPPVYEKTLFLQAGIHGGEHDSMFTLYRMMQILFTLRNQAGYTAWQQIYDKCRLIIIPVVNPYGKNLSAQNVPFEDTQHGINLNRNMDFNHQYSIASAGVAGNYPFEMNETQHIRDVVELYGVEHIDLAIDYHDGPGIAQHYWINYSVDAPNRPLVNGFISYLLDKHGIAPEDAIIPNCKDTSTSTGIVSAWFNKTMGVTASTNEWLGGIWGYDFSSEQMTHSLEIRSNMLFMALNNDVKGWQVREPADAQYFHFDYPKAFTAQGLRDGGHATVNQVTDAKIMARWDNLASENPSRLVKSASLGLNVTGDNVHTYTFGSGSKKVLYVGGAMRYGATHLIDEFAIYLLVEYLCNDYVVNQSKFLKDLRDNYTIIVLPFIDNIAQNSAPYQPAGLNNTSLSRQRWTEVGGITQPSVGQHGVDNYGVKIIKALVDTNTDLKCIVSGGEIMEGFSLNDQTVYSTNYQTHIATPKRQVFDKQAYKTHLETNRSELVVAEPTDGFTFADYAYDNHSIPAYFVQLKVSDRFTDLSNDHTLTEDKYMHFNYEAGRRIANIVNLFVL